MKLNNVSFEDVQWFFERGLLLKMERSKMPYYPPEAIRNQLGLSFTFFDNWMALTLDTAELIESSYLKNLVNGYNIEVIETSEIPEHLEIKIEKE